VIWFTFQDSNLIYMEDVKKLPKYVFLTMANLYLSFLLTYFKVKVKMKNFILQDLFESPALQMYP